VQVVVNEQHISVRARRAQLHTWAGLAFMLGGFGITFLGIEYIGWSYACLFAGLFFFNAGARDRLRFVRRPREDELVAGALRGLDHRYRLIQYLPGVPASHVLVTPGGVFVFELRHHFGSITVTGTRYERRWNWLLLIGSLAEGGIGNPARDAERAAAAVRDYLAKKLAAPSGDEIDQAASRADAAPAVAADQIPVYPVVLFTNPRAHVTVHDAAVPTLTTRDLKSWLRKQVQRVKLSASVQKQMYHAFEV
jgi:hypothetical protein